MGATLLVLAGCGGSSSSSSSGNAQLRVINATRTHASIDLSSAVLTSTTTGTATKPISAVARQSASATTSLAGGSYSLQITDAGSTTTLASTSPTLTKDQSYSLLAYESGGVVRVALLGENDTAPAAGSSAVRIFNAAADLGAVDVYITAPTVDLATVSAPSFALAASTSVQSTTTLTFTPGTYRVRVTASGNRDDVRLDIPSTTFADQKTTTVVLTPTLGVGLVDGAVLVEKGDFASFANTKARVRLVSGVSGGTVTASAGTSTIEAGALSPSIGSYVVVPSGSAAWSVNIGGRAASVPPITLAAGSDNTVLVTGTTAAASASLLVDDDHAPAVSSNVNLRLINGLQPGSAGLSLTVDFSLVANNVAAGASSGYKGVTGNTSMRLEVSSSLSPTPISLQTALNIPGGGVYSIFVLGDPAAPITSVRKDR